MFNVHIVHTPEPEHLAYLRERLDSEINITTGEALPNPSEYQILVAGRPTREQITASPKLQAVLVPFAGIPLSTRELMAEFPEIDLHNLHHNADIVAELTMALLLTSAKFIIPLDSKLRQNDWTPRYEPSQSVFLMNKTAVILGYGAIGQRLTELCRAFGMTVVAVRKHRGPYIADADMDIPHEVVPVEELNEVLPRADVLIIALPQTDETEGLIGAKELAMLPKYSILVNIGRGPIVDEEALYNALKDSSLYAAATDVWYNYPPDEASRTNTPPANFPFHELSNFVMSPHRGGASLETEYYRMAYLALALNAAVQGETMPHKIDLEAGY